MSTSVGVLTPWYPRPEHPYNGCFVQTFAEAAARRCSGVTVYHLANGHQYREANRIVSTGLSVSNPAECQPWGRVDGCSVSELDEPWGRAHRIHVESGGGPTSRSGRVHAATESLRSIGKRYNLLNEGIIHAHSTIEAGWPAVQVAPRDTRVFVTEHVFETPFKTSAEKELYAEVIERCAGFFCVSNALRRTILNEFPEFASKIHICPPPVPFERVPSRGRSVTDLRRWIYIGELSPAKGVRELLQAFTICRESRGDLSLTMVGGGPLMPELTQSVARLGLSDSVSFSGPVANKDVVTMLLDHDLLVHPSHTETLGLTLLEAAACETPVLATRCGGTVETLGRFPNFAELVPVSDGPEELVCGYHRLLGRVGNLEAHNARTQLQRSYSMSATISLLSRHYFGDL